MRRCPVDKQEAIRRVNQLSGKESLSNSNTVFANENTAKSVWWFNIAPLKFQWELNVLLAHRNGHLIWLRIPPGTFHSPFPEFSKRSDGRIDVEISCEKHDRYLRDIKSKGTGYDFRPFAVRDFCISEKNGGLEIPLQEDTGDPSSNNEARPPKLFENRVALFDREIANILAQLAHFVHPKIVAKVQERNKKEYSRFEQLFANKIEVGDYLFEGSACVFPGVRRFVSRRGKRFTYNSDYKAIIDGNRFPRHIWTYLVSGIAYSGPTWKNTELNEFELVHLFAHKETETEFERQFFAEFDAGVVPHGNFTSAANVALLPKGTVRPTDNSTTIKGVFFKRCIDLYGESPLSGRSRFKESLVPDWFDDLCWNDPLLPDEWESKTDRLMEYRRKRLAAIMERATE